MKKMVILGSGGHALNVIDLLLNEQKEFEPVGILDPHFKGNILGVSVLGNDDLLSGLKKKGIEYAFPAIGFGQGVNNVLRRKIFEKLKGLGYKIPSLISSKSFIRSGVRMGEGNFIQAGSVIDSEVILGNNVAIGFHVLDPDEARPRNPFRDPYPSREVFQGYLANLATRRIAVMRLPVIRTAP